MFRSLGHISAASPAHIVGCWMLTAEKNCCWRLADSNSDEEVTG